MGRNQKGNRPRPEAPIGDLKKSHTTAVLVKWGNKVLTEGYWNPDEDHERKSESMEEMSRWLDRKTTFKAVERFSRGIR
jgi:hypothetical protein